MVQVLTLRDSTFRKILKDYPNLARNILMRAVVRRAHFVRIFKEVKHIYLINKKMTVQTMIENALRFGDQQELFRENKANERYVKAVKEVVEREMKLFKAMGKFQNFDPNSVEARIIYLD